MPNIESPTNQEKSRPNLTKEIKTEWSGLSSSKKTSFVFFILTISTILIPIVWRNWTSNRIVTWVNNIGNTWLKDLLDTMAWSLFRGNIFDGISIYSMRAFYPFFITILVSLTILYIFLILIIYFPNTRKSVVNRSSELLEEEFGIRSSLSKGILIFPVVIMLLVILLMAIPGTREFSFLMLSENYPVESLTFLFLLFASFQGFYLAFKNRKAKGDFIILFFYLTFALGIFFVGMEEISWGQQYLKFDTPEILISDNIQGELTLHNLGGLQGWSEVFHILFALGGIAGIWLNSSSRFREIGVPFILVTWFITILVFAGLDLFIDFKTFGFGINREIREISEVVEMLIGISGFLYLWLINKRLDNR